MVSDPAGIDCTGEAGDSCSTETIAEGTVTLTASPAPGYLFKSWRRCDRKEGEFGVEGRQCTIALDEAKEVGAKFVKVDSLAISKAAGSGPGLAKTKPGGISCGYTCGSSEARFYADETALVIVKLNKGTSAVEWTSGAGTCTGRVEAAESECEVPMGTERELVAKFE